jgi:hypothetical protein
MALIRRHLKKLPSKLLEALTVEEIFGESSVRVARI